MCNFVVLSTGLKPGVKIHVRVTFKGPKRTPSFRCPRASVCGRVTPKAILIHLVFIQPTNCQQFYVSHVERARVPDINLHSRFTQRL